jgi:predicted signal transduction protein with EAL and GGDEF domain
MTSLRATELADHLVRPVGRVLGRDGKPLAYTTSIGIAEYPPGMDLPSLLMRADLAMYQAKQAGGGSWRVFGDRAMAEPARIEPTTATLQTGHAILFAPVPAFRAAPCRDSASLLASYCERR